MNDIREMAKEALNDTQMQEIKQLIEEFHEYNLNKIKRKWEEERYSSITPPNPILFVESEKDHE